MKIHYLLAIYIHCCIIKKTRGTFYDPICDSDGGVPMQSKLLPHSHDCSKYLQCSNGIAYMHKCPPNLHWNRKAQICDYPSAAKCQLFIAATAAQNYKCLSGYYYRHERNCSKFYYCKYGVKVPLSCVAGFHWNQLSKRCDAPQLAKCPYTTDTTLTELIQNGDKYAGCPLNDISWLSKNYLPYPGDCTRFLKCSYGRAWILKCPMGLQWSVPRNRCDYAFYVKCQYNGESEKESNESESSTASIEASGKDTKTMSILPLDLTTVTVTVGTLTAGQQQSHAGETTITELITTTTECIKNINEVINTSTAKINDTIVIDIIESTSEFADATNENTSTTIERTTRSVDSTVKDVVTEISFTGTSNINAEDIKITSESVMNFINNDIDATSTTETTAASIINNLYDTTMQDEEITTKVIQTNCAIAGSTHDKTKTSTETIGSTKDSVFVITTQIIAEDTKRTPPESVVPPIEVTTEIADVTSEKVDTLVDTVENAAEKKRVGTAAQVTVGLSEIETNDSTINLYESFTQVATEIVDSATEIETTTDASAVQVTTDTVDTTTAMTTGFVYSSNDDIETTVEATTEIIETTKEIVDTRIPDKTKTTINITIETTTGIIISANDASDITKPARTEKTQSNIAQIEATSKDSGITNRIVETTIVNVQSTFLVGNAGIQINASTTESTKPAKETMQQLTTQDPRLPFRAPQCSGINNRVKLVALNCYQFYQCFEGYAYLLNCYEGYAFSLAQSNCIPADGATCKHNSLQ